MCTSITFQSKEKENFLGRTMDFSHDIEPGVYVASKNYEWYSLITREKCVDLYSFICIGQRIKNIFGVFDGVNEMGFAVATLYFKDYAYYNFPLEEKTPIASLDFSHYILGRCSSVKDLKDLLENITIMGVRDPVTKTEAPLHWIVTDRSGECAVIEQTKEGLKVMDNPIGVLANSPDFNWQMTNLRNYMNISVEQEEEAKWREVSLTPFGQGMGSIGLPGGFTSPERFARTAFIKTHAQVPEKKLQTVLECFHIMNGVSIPKGIVLTDKGTYDYTKYIAVMNTNTCEYYFKTYEDDEIKTVNLSDYYTYNEELIFLGNISSQVEEFKFF